MLMLRVSVCGTDDEIRCISVKIIVFSSNCGDWHGNQLTAGFVFDHFSYVSGYLEANTAGVDGSGC